MEDFYPGQAEMVFIINGEPIPRLSSSEFENLVQLTQFQFVRSLQGSQEHVLLCQNNAKEKHGQQGPGLWD